MIRLLIILIASLPALAGASEPTVDSIDYSAPESYLMIPSTLGDRAKIVEQAVALKGRNDRATVRKVLEWMDANLTYDAEAA